MDANQKRTYLIALGIMLFTFAVYGQVLWHDFIIYDDYRFVARNENVLSGLTLNNLKLACSFNFENESYLKPVTWLSHMLDIELFGLNPGGHHLTSLLLHIANAILLFSFLKRATGAAGQSAMVAALFAIHPLNIESVAWIAERKGVLSTFFLILTLCAYAHYVKRQTVVRYMMVFLCLILGQLSKPILVTLPFLLIILDFWPFQRLPARTEALAPAQSTSRQRAYVLLVAEKLPLLAVSLCISLITYSSEKKYSFINEASSIFDRSANALSAYIGYLGKMIWPADLTIFYPPTSPSVGEVFFSIAVLVAITALAIRGHRNQPYLLVGWLWYIVASAPVIGFIQIGAYRADRYTYIPLIGIFIMISWGGSYLLNTLRCPQRIIWTLSIVVVLAFGTTTFLQLKYWKNSKTLFTHALEITQGNWVAHTNLGCALAEENKCDEAIEQYAQALRIKPNDAQAQCSWGVALDQTGRFREALDHYTQALKYNPRDAVAHNNIALTLASENNFPEAREHFQEALRIRPSYAEAHNNYAIALANQHLLDEARSHFKAATQINPAYADAYYGLGLASLRLDDFATAVEAFKKTIALVPDDYEAHMNLGMAYRRLGMANLAQDEYRFLMSSGSPEAIRLAKELMK